MKTKSIILASMAIVSLAACKREPVPEPSKDRSFTAGFETKTSVNYDADANKYAISWEAGDQVSLFDGAANNVFTAQAAGLSTTLTGKAEDAETYYALYPYAAGASMSGAVISTAIPTSAAVTADGSANFANISVAKTSGTSLTFGAVSGILKLTLGEAVTNVSEIRFKAAGNESIAGSVTIDMSAAAPALAVVNGASTIVMTPASGSYFAAGHSYYVAAAPATLASGIVLEFVTPNGVVSKAQEKALTISAGKVMNLGVIPSVEVPDPELACPYWHDFANGNFGIGPIFDWGGWEDGYYYDMLTNPDVLSGASWSLTDAGYFEWAGTEGWRKGIQLGTGGMTVSNFALSSPSFPGEITKVTLGYNSGITDASSLVVSCTVGDAVFGAPVAHGDGDYEAVFTGSASGDIVIKINATTNGAVYLYYVGVEYDPNSTPQPIDDREESGTFEDLIGEEYGVEW